MLEHLDVEQSVRLTILNLMLVLYDCGIQEVHVGGLMRILGVPNNKACAHDDELVVLNEDFVKYVEQINEPRPVNQPLH
jgi:hypothetical protein